MDDFSLQQCAICLSDLPSMLHPFFHTRLETCGHVYHTLCLRNWFHRASTCPSCRCVPSPWPFDDIPVIAAEEDEEDEEDEDEDEEGDDDDVSEDDTRDDANTADYVPGEEEEDADDDDFVDEDGGDGDGHGHDRDDDLRSFRDMRFRELRLTVQQAAHQLLTDDERVGSLADVIGYGVPLGDFNAVTLLRALSTNTKLSSLDLMGQNITNTSCRVLGTVLKRNRGLRYVDLSNNDIDAAGVASIARALQRNKRVTHLFLNSVLIGDDGAVELSKAIMANDSLGVLGLRATRIGPKGARALAVALKQNKSLRTVDLGANNRITENAKRALVEAVTNRPAAPACTLVF